MATRLKWRGILHLPPKSMPHFVSRRGEESRKPVRELPHPFFYVHPAVEFAGCTRSSDHPDSSTMEGGRVRAGVSSGAIDLSRKAVGPPQLPWPRPRAASSVADNWEG